LIFEQSFANPKLVFLELQPARLKLELESTAVAPRVFLPEVMLRGLINPGAIPPILSQCVALLIDKPQRKQEMLRKVCATLFEPSNCLWLDPVTSHNAVWTKYTIS
jgi:hypothetical protein